MGILILNFSKVFAENEAFDSLRISSNVEKATLNSSFEVTLQDKTNESEKVYLPISEGLEFQRLKQGDAVIKRDSDNNQLMIEWKNDEKHEVVLRFKALNLGAIVLQAFDDKHNTSDVVSVLVQKEQRKSVSNQLSNRMAGSILDGLTPFAQSPYGTVMDAKGQYVSGKPVQKAKTVIPLIHYGTQSAAKDITLNGSAIAVPSINKRFAEGDILKVNNIGYYQGRPCVLAIKVLSPGAIMDVYSNFPMTISSARDGSRDPADPLEFNIEIWIEDASGNAIRDPEVNALLPLKIKVPKLNNGENRNVVTLLSKRADITNVFVRDASLSGSGQSYLDAFGGNYQLLGREWSDMNYNILYNASQHLYFSASLKDNEGNVVPYKYQVDFLKNHRLFSSSSNDMILPLPYSAPTTEEEKNEETFQAKFNIGQTLLAQNSSFYPNSLSVNFTMGDLIKANTNALYPIQVKDTNKKSVLVSKAFQTSSNTVSMTISKSTLSQLANNQLSITGSLALNTEAPDLINTFQSDGFFHIPIEVSNSDQPDLKTKGETLVKMPPPTGSPISQVVSLYSSSDELNPAELVTDLKSILPQDKVKVVGIKESKKFEQLGNTSVDVLIESELTHVQGVVTVPIEVETGNLKFDNVPQSIDFGMIPIRSDIQSVPVKKTINDLAIRETRYLGKWELGVTANEALTGQGNKKTLGRLFYLSNDGKWPLTNKLQIVESGGYTGRKQPLNVSKTWGETKGLILEINPGEALRGGYQGEVTWTLRDVPI